MNAIPKQVRENIDIVAKHYGLPKENQAIMRDDAKSRPANTAAVYAAIVRSLPKEKK